MSCFSERLKTDHHVDEGIDGNANLLIMKTDFKTRREGRHAGVHICVIHTTKFCLLKMDVSLHLTGGSLPFLQK